MSLPTPPVIMPCPVCGEQQRIMVLSTNMRDDDTLNIQEAFVTCEAHGRWRWTPERADKPAYPGPRRRRMLERLRKGSRY